MQAAVLGGTDRGYHSLSASAARDQDEREPFFTPFVSGTNAVAARDVNRG